MNAPVTPPATPLGLLAELTHRCPLQCPYCSNPLALERRSQELDTATWQRVLEEAAALGVLQVHLSGGEPTARADLEALVRSCAASGLYSNLITSGVLLPEPKLDALAEAGLDHVQLSVQDVEPANADRIAGFKGGHARKLALGRAIVARGLPLTLNVVVHRANLDSLEALIALALDMGARRIEIAHAQYYGWALANRAALMPTEAQVLASAATVEKARRELEGRLVIDAVVPDYYARWPKPCMGGWGSRALNVTPSGKVLPCHAAETIPGLRFDNVREKSLAEIWRHSAAFNAFRGTDWMEEPCSGCERKLTCRGGCRCQAMALAGRAEAADPACWLSPHHGAMRAMAEADSAATGTAFRYRRFDG